MSNYLAEAFAPIDAHYRSEVLKNTWGHLAPYKNRTYRGRIVFAVGCFGSDDLNPTVIDCEMRNPTLGSLDSSPWFYDALSEFLGDMVTLGRDGDDEPEVIEAGGVYRWEGALKNYEFRGTVRRLDLVARIDEPDAEAGRERL